MLKQLSSALCAQHAVEPAADQFVPDEGWVSIQMLPTSDMFIGLLPFVGPSACS